ncbi:hypothetical protein BD779DRAFT_1465871 [Infundibulicybe gibba]|nr:hypothetical protein BD779DRAFT_1465871 [Infundibulicybe gibba]
MPRRLPNIEDTSAATRFAHSSLPLPLSTPRRMAYSQPFPLAAPQVKSTPQPTFGPDLAVRLICPECRDPNPNIVEEFGSGDLVCGNCGLVLGDRIVDTRSEWRTFANDEGDDPSRVGAASDPLMEGIEQLDTVISFRDGGSGIARELQRAASRSQNSRSERNLLTAFRDISSCDTAKQLYKRSDEEKLLRGKPLDAAGTCAADVPGNMHTHARVEELLGQCYKALEQTLISLRVQRRTAQTHPRRVLRTCLCDTAITWTYLQCAVICSDIIIAARKHGIADGRSPVSIAGGAIYFTCHLLGKVKSVEISARWRAKEKLVKQEWMEEGKAKMDRLPVDSTK